MIYRIFLFLGLLFSLIFSLSSELSAQGLNGYVYNDNNEVLPYVNIYVRELETGTVTNEEGYYYYQLIPGNYTVVFSAIGYNSVSKNIRIADEDERLDVYLESAYEQIEEITVKASKKDPAYEIIQNVINNKRSLQSQLNSFSSEVYIKAYEDKKDEKVSSSSTEAEVTEESLSLTFGSKKETENDSVPEINLLEMELTLNYLYPNLYKEERSAIKKYGDQGGLFIPIFGEADYDIYDNLMSLKGISDVPLISPVSNAAILSYKYKLESADSIDGRLVYKIKVIPRKKGNATCSGYLYVNDAIWNIQRLDLDIYKGALKVYDAFNLNMTYDEVEEGLWLPLRREFIYKTKQGRFKSYDGQTLILFSDFQKDVEFPEKYFRNELAVTTLEAYEKDSIFWNERRPEPLTVDQKVAIAYRDSVEAVLDSPEYKDSIDAEVNKIDILDLVWTGLEFQNWRRKERMFISHLPALFSYNIIGGFRAGPFIYYGRRYESGKTIDMNAALNIGLNRKDVNGRFRIYHMYDPYHRGSVRASLGRTYRPILPNDAILNQINPNNWVELDFYELSTRRELFNGFYLSLGADYYNVRSVSDRFTLTPLDSFFIELNAYEITDPLVFDDYNTFSTLINIDYTPGQRYMTEPNRKVILGSKWPTMSVAYRKGWNNILNSISDYNYLEASLRQSITLGPLGTSRYDARMGSFISKDEIPFMDLRRFRRSDPWIMGNPLKTFQLLDTTLATTDLFAELHYIHHFNGALVNNVPLVKKLGIGAVIGGGFLWVQDASFSHSEVMAGLERTFKLGPRRRLRLGVYGVTAKSTERQLNGRWKFSIDIIDTWKKDWSF